VFSKSPSEASASGRISGESGSSFPLLFPYSAPSCLAIDRREGKPPAISPVMRIKEKQKSIAAGLGKSREFCDFREFREFGVPPALTCCSPMTWTTGDPMFVTDRTGASPHQIFRYPQSLSGLVPGRGADLFRARIRHHQPNGSVAHFSQWGRARAAHPTQQRNELSPAPLDLRTVLYAARDRGWFGALAVGARCEPQDHTASVVATEASVARGLNLCPNLPDASPAPDSTQSVAQP